ncbi:MAG: D-glycero-beta-D-manno-heptose 1,7-bisphosphate 7-phosphatase [bacterium]|nr:D-glycero-beta-D-manno-heptose 1,7-bisphosphate 7-phosphatase [bacterium]
MVATFSSFRSRVAFLDRDGVINEDSLDFVRSLVDFRFLPGSLGAIAALTGAGWRVVVVSNQSGLARGLIARHDLEAIHDSLRGRVRSLGGRIDGIFVCPHAPEEGCRCRKPATGLFEEAESRLGLRARGALLVGDRESDLAAGAAAGCFSMLVQTGRGKEWLREGSVVPEAPVFPDLAAAVEALLSGEVGESRGGGNNGYPE